MRLVIALGLAVVVLISAASAEARRPATPEERASIAAQFPSGPWPPECTIAVISTVDPQWAKATGTDAPGCPKRTGYATFKYGASGWRYRFSDSRLLRCPFDTLSLAAGRDLGVCRPARSYIMCSPHPGKSRVRALFEHPRRCNTYWWRESPATSVNLAQLRWRRWGTRVARGRGIEKGFHLPYQRIRVRIRAYRRHHCGDTGDFVYTRMRVDSRYGTGVERFPAKCYDRKPPASLR